MMCMEEVGSIVNAVGNTKDSEPHGREVILHYFRTKMLEGQ